MRNKYTPKGPMQGILKGAGLAAALLAANAAPVSAQTTGTELAQTDSASMRIALAGKLRMLSQQVVSSACFLHAGLETDSSRATLTAAKDEFEGILAALEFGDAARGIATAEDRQRTLAGLARLNTLWEPMAALVTQIAADQSSDAMIAELADQSMDLLEVASRLMVQINAQYANQTTVLKSDAVRIDLASRQRMLSQQIAKNGCLVSRGISVADSTAELQAAAANFDASMNALRFGLQEVGILPPPNDAIAASLDEVANNWSFMARTAENLTAGNSVDDVTLGVVYLMSNQVSDNMETVVDQYAQAAQLDG